MMDMLKRPKLEGPFDQVYAKDNSEPMTQAEKEKKMEELNPKGLYILSYLMEPFFRSATFLHSWLLFFFIKLLKARLSLVLLAKGSVLALFLDVDTLRESHLLLMYLAVFSVGVTCILLFVHFYLSRGKTLPRRALKYIDLKGKVAIVTGGYSGIGYETVLQLLKWNCKVVICGRNKTKATNAIEKLKSTNSFDPNNLSFIEMDLDNLLSVKKASELFEKSFDRLDFLINNAGIWTSKLTLTSFNLEAQFSSNFLGHFYLTELLLKLVKKTGGRILNVSSIAHFKYDPSSDPLFETKSTTSLNETFLNSYYGRSKLFNVWHTNAVQRRVNVDAKNVVCVSLAPGVVSTPLLWPLARAHFYLVPRYINLLTVKRPVDGAANILFLCATDVKNLLPGGYYDNMRLAFVSKHAHDHQREEKLYSIAEELVNKLAK